MNPESENLCIVGCMQYSTSFMLHTELSTILDLFEDGWGEREISLEWGEDAGGFELAQGEPQQVQASKEAPEPPVSPLLDPPG